ncbi:PAS domain S-box protein [Mastigocladopsis repens]|uniref:PAS domain S-box protein n=1 Tax=Mastigocladopsis repens TaxID=221287 RepID=UPI0012EA1909|nr:PAS domain S-box protein [Mastigocladopsis repens]
MNKHIGQFVVVFVTFIGCSVLLGWHQDISLLKIGFPGNPHTMKPNTGVCLLLLGVSLGLLQRQRLPQSLYFIAQGSALLTTTIGLVTLGEYFFGWNLGIDELLFDDGIVTATHLYPGRIEEVTAFNLTLLGIALVLLAQKTRQRYWLAQSLSCVVGFTATLTLVGYLFGARILNEFAVATRATALHTAMALIVLCVGILFTHPNKGLMQTVTSSSIGGAIARRFLPWAIIVPLAINSFTTWLEVNKYDYTLIHALETVIIFLILSILILSNASLIDQVEAYRQRAEHKLRESEQQFRRAVMSSPLPIMIHAEDGEIVQINHVWTDITGYKPEEIRTIAQWTEQAYGERQEYVREAIDRLYNFDCRVAEGEFTVCTRSGEQRIWDFYSAPLGRTPDGRRLVLTTAIDITKRKQAEEALVQMNATLEMRVRKRTAELAKINLLLQHELYERQRVTQALEDSERKFRATFEQTFQLIGLLTPDGTVLELNQGALEFIRARREDAINRPFWELSCWSCTVEIQENLKAAIAQAAAGQFIRMEVILPDADGVMRDFDFSLKPVRDESGRVVLLIPEGRDITNLKRTQSELLSVSERLKYLLTASPAVIFSCRPHGDYGATFISENVTTILGYQPQDFLDNSDFWVNHVYPEDVERVLREIPQIFERNYHSHQYRFLCADGTYCWLETHTKLVRDKKGNAVEFVGSLVDITERKALEEEVALKQQLLNGFISNAPVGMTVLDSQLRYTLINEALAEINGIPAKEHMGKTPWEMIPHLAPKQEEIFRQVLTTRQPILNVEINGETPKLPGVNRTWLVSYFPIHDQIRCSLGIVVAEITERKAAQAALRESEERFQAFMNHSPALAWITDTDGRMLYASQTYLRTIQQATDSIIGKSLFDLYPAEFAQQWIDNIKKVAVSNQVVEAIETAPRRDGTVGDFLVYEFPIKGLSGQHFVGGVAVDVTEYRQALLALAEWETLLRSIGDNLPHGAIYQIAGERDGSYCFYYISAGVENITEVKPEDALKDSRFLHNQFLEEDYPKFLQAIDESLKNMSVIDIQLRIRTPSGKLKWLHFRSTPRCLNDGRIVWDGLVVDVTEIKQAEQALRLQAEKEKALNRVIKTIRNSLELQTIFNTAVAETAKLLQADRAEIAQYIPSQKLWKHVAEYRRTPDLPTALGVDIPDEGNEVAARIKKLEVVRINDPRTIDDEVNSKFAQIFLGTWLLVPLHINSTVWGSLSLARNGQHSTWQDSEVELTMTVADQLVIAIQQSELYQRLQIANQELQRLATLDGLTQLANRRHFDEHLNQEWLRLAREQNPLSLILCDVDYFKLYNDTYGHPAGDTCLVQIAQAISLAVKRPADLVARYGGEEFAVLLPNTDADGAIQVVQLIQTKVRQRNLPHIASLVGQYVTLSFGIATTIPSHNGSVQALIKAADRALYQAKDNGRNCYQSIRLVE